MKNLIVLMLFLLLFIFVGCENVNDETAAIEPVVEEVENVEEIEKVEVAPEIIRYELSGSLNEAYDKLYSYRISDEDFKTLFINEVLETFGNRYEFLTEDLSDIDLRTFVKKLRSEILEDDFDNIEEWKDITRSIILLNEYDIKTEITINFENALTTQIIDIQYKTKLDEKKDLIGFLMVEGSYVLGDIISPYVINEEDTGRVLNNENLYYTLHPEDEVIYGYKVDMSRMEMPVGVLREDLMYLGIRNLLSSDLIFDDAAILRITGIGDNTVLTPYDDFEDRVSIFENDSKENTFFIPGKREYRTENLFYKSGNIVVGQFNSIKEIDYGFHKLKIATKDIESDHDYIHITETTYNHLMEEVFYDSENLLMPNMIIGYINTDDHDIRAEGFRGSLIEVITPRTEINYKKGFNDSYSYFINYIGLTTPARKVIHELLHATFDDEFEGWWSIEGIAEYYMGPMLLKADIIDEETLNNIYKDLVTFYLEDIAPYDIPLHIYKRRNLSKDELEEKYPIKIHEFNTYGMNPQDHYRWSVNPNKTYWFPYVKGAMVFIYIDEYVKLHSGGVYDLDDVLAEYLTKEDPVNKYVTFEIIVENLSGKEFRGFFDEYVIDAKTLPFAIENEVLIIKDWQQ